MLNKRNIVMLPVIILAIVISSMGLDSRPREDKYDADYILRSVTGAYDLQKNTVSNIEFYTTNYGIFGLNVAQNRGGGFWPRGSQNQYIFAGGIWFGAIKKRPNDTADKKYVTITYNPNNGRSWMVPGRINPDNTSRDLIENDAVTKYRTYFSTDFKRGDGNPIIASDGEAWPIWDILVDDTIRNNRYFGKYIDEVGDRTTARYEKGPAFISGEDIFSTFKDTDLSRYDDGAGQRRNQGYPLRLQYEQMIYSWGFGDYKDFIFLKYEIANYSRDTLKECWMAPVMDVDIALAQNSQNGAANDRTRFYDEDTHLNLAIQWTQGDQGEQGQGFGYLGFNFLESPAVFRTEWRKITENTVGNTTTYEIQDYMALETKDTVVMVDMGGGVFEPKDSSIVVRDTIVKNQTMIVTNNGGVLDTNVTVHYDITNYLRKDKRFFTVDEQIGLVTFRNWPIQEDKSGDDERYNYMASRARDGDDGAGDKRFLMATGPFHMLPKDTVRVVVGMMIAKSSVREEADGSTEDLEALVRLCRFAQTVYDDNFRAPMPPDAANFTKWTPLNNAIQLEWGTDSEDAIDAYEDGLSFLGYRLYRARRIDLDTFNLYQTGPTAEYSKGSGPFGWKQIAQWQVPFPFQKSFYQAGKPGQEEPQFPYIDSLRIVGPWYNDDGTIDSNSIRVMRVGQGVRLFTDTQIKNSTLFNAYSFRGSVLPVVAFIDTAFFSKPWGEYYTTLVNETEYPLWYNPFNPSDARNNNPLMKNIMIGRLKLDPALVKFNPLLSEVQSVNVSPLDTPLIPDRIGDTLYLKNTYREAIINGTKQLIVDKVVPIAVNNVMKDSLHIAKALTKVYSLIKEGSAKTEFPRFVHSEPAKNIIRNYIAQATNNRTFIDIGDDNRDGRVLSNIDPTKTEKLLNSVDYYYKLLSYDEGDYNQPTPSKLNGASEGLPNQIKTHPAAAPAGDYSKFEITYVDSAKIGGLYNFKFFAIDGDRVNQLFAGHELELEFNPWWSLTTLELVTNKFTFGLYYRDLTLRDITTGDVLYQGRTIFENTPCQWSYRGGFTEKALSWYLADTVVIDPVDPNKMDDFGTFYSNGIKRRNGYFTTGDFTQTGYCYSNPFQQPAQNVFGFSFDYSILQYGGHFRPDSVVVTNPNISTVVYPMQIIEDPNGLGILTTTRNGVDIFENDLFGVTRGRLTYGSFNNGPGDFEVTFEPGGVETMVLKFDRGNKQNTFNVPFLKMKVRNLISYRRPDPSGDSITVSYPLEYTEMELDTNSNGLPDLLLLGQSSNDYIGRFNTAATAWVNSRNNNRLTAVPRQSAYPANVTPPGSFFAAGQQNRYYLSAISTDGVDTVDFVNIVNIAGVNFAFDYPNKGRFNNTTAQWATLYAPEEYVYREDFKAGDKVVLPVRGGALGLPAPGAKVRVKVSTSVPEEGQYTEDHLNQVKVVPNPYYISHQMQSSPYDSKLFFTKLPPVCTISIYTVAGDLVKEIQHDEYTSPEPGKHAVEVWNLLSSNAQRVQSQTFVAVIRTPNNKESVVQFSVVVGGFRLIQSN